ncbi:unnamed protein product [Thelazia callipaeda]|uniref:Deoxyuridine 5'-triphosphate nucleotidohydrolase n=1 Tax=Thelazia callipaeda TaxID=103827 RepID=A0A0N5D525_THECL|nr:unnamed protein product [Thelazia callipaeda]
MTSNIGILSPGGKNQANGTREIRRSSEIICSQEVEKKHIYFRKVTENAHTPTYESTWAAGADLYSAYDCLVPASGKACIKTDLELEIPKGYYGRIAPRSGLAVKRFIDVGAGVIDSDYRGPLNVKKGDRVAQLICEKISHCEFIQMMSLEESKRGADGFGSTGI